MDGSMPETTQPASTAPILAVEDLRKHFTRRRSALSTQTQLVRAVDGVSFTIGAGETLALVGESGCGKSTVGRTILRLLEPTAGRIVLEGTDITTLGRADMRPYRRRVQMVFQDPYSSLNPKMTIGAILDEPLRIHGMGSANERRARIGALLQRVGLKAEQMERYPHEFSGGQRQRIGIARALALEPRVIVADEPVSALDVSIQAQVLNLLVDLQQELGVSYLFISHDLAVVRHVSHRVAVMYLGRIVEKANTAALFRAPLHPYTEMLLAAAPVANPKIKRPRTAVRGEIPSPSNPPRGCHFHPRCPIAQEACRTTAPPLRELEPGHWVACHLR